MGYEIYLKKLNRNKFFLLLFLLGAFAAMTMLLSDFSVLSVSIFLPPRRGDAKVFIPLRVNFVKVSVLRVK